MKILAIIIFITGAGLGYWRGYVKGNKKKYISWNGR
jgi:hypothetical protein